MSYEYIFYLTRMFRNCERFFFPSSCRSLGGNRFSLIFLDLYEHTCFPKKTCFLWFWQIFQTQEKSITKEESKQEGSKEGRAQEESLTKEGSIIEEVSFKEESVKEQEMRDRKGECPIMDIDFKFDFTLCRFDVSVNLFTLWGDSTVDLKNLWKNI